MRHSTVIARRRTLSQVAKLVTLETLQVLLLKKDVDAFLDVADLR